jgi:hypothetical protein
MNKHTVTTVFLLLLCLTPFIIGINGPFLLDDEPNLAPAAKVQHVWSSWYQVIFGNESGTLRRPISNFSFLLNFQLFGNAALSFKIINLILHGINGVLVYVFIRQLLPLIQAHSNSQSNKTLALIASSIWIIHPIQISTVLYVVQRMTELSALFMLLSLILALKFFKLRHASSKQGVYYLLGVAGLAFLGLLAKENAALIPLLLLVIYLCTPTERRLTTEGHRLFNTLTIFIPLALLLFLAAYYLHVIIDSYQMREFTFSERIITQPYVIGHYLYTIFFPNAKAMGLFLDDIPIRSATEWGNWLGIVTIIFSICIAVFLRHRNPIVAFAILWYFACHALESTFIPLEMAFEHRNYLALIGPALLIANGLITFKNIISQNLWRVIISIVFIALFVVTLSRAHQWSSKEIFYRSEASNHPNSLRALNELAALEFAIGNNSSGIAIIERLEILYPNDFWVRSIHLNYSICISNSSKEPLFQSLLKIVKHRPHSLAIAPALLQVTNNIIKNDCKFININRFDLFIADIIDELIKAQQLEEAEKLYQIRSYLASKIKDPIKEEHMLVLGSNVNPNGTIAKFALAYFYLNAGEIERASQIAKQLQEIIQWGPEKYRVDELQKFIDTYKSTQANANKY